MNTAICTHCKKQIPNHEQAYVHDGNVVCQSCNEILKTVKAEVVRIELTKKKWKAVTAFGLFLILIGTFTSRGSLPFVKQWIETGITEHTLFTFGITIFLAGKFLAWWNHG